MIKCLTSLDFRNSGKFVFVEYIRQVKQKLPHFTLVINLILYLRISSSKEDPVKFVIIKTQIFYESCTSDYYREDISH